MAQVSPQRDQLLGRAEAPAQQPDHVQVAQPFTIADVAFPAVDLFDVARVDQQDLEAARFK